jgi:integrase
LNGGIVIPKRRLSRAGIPLPGIIAEAGERTARRFIEFFAATIRNKYTRIAYIHAVARFLEFCETRGLTLERVDSLVVATYIEHLTQIRSAPTVKLHLAAIRVCLDWLVSGGALSVNPAWSVRGPKHVVKKGKTPVLSAAHALELLDSIDTTTLIGLRDRALIGVMVYTFARRASGADRKCVPCSGPLHRHRRRILVRQLAWIFVARKGTQTTRSLRRSSHPTELRASSDSLAVAVSLPRTLQRFSRNAWMVMCESAEGGSGTDGRMGEAFFI